MIRLSIAIQHTPARADDPVFKQLVSDLPMATVVTDPDPQNDYASTWRTYRECLRSTPFNATHRLILQDDVRVCRNFVKGVEAAIQSRPDSLLSFFISMMPQYSATANAQAWDRGDAWSALDTREWTPSQALCWPAFLIGPMIRHADANPIMGSYTADDQVVGQFLRGRGMNALASVPSLVQHVHAEQTSLDGSVNRVGDHRYALHCWFGADGETEWDPAVDVDWQRGAIA